MRTEEGGLCPRVWEHGLYLEAVSTILLTIIGLLWCCGSHSPRIKGASTSTFGCMIQHLSGGIKGG